MALNIINLFLVKTLIFDRQETLKTTKKGNF